MRQGSDLDAYRRRIGAHAAWRAEAVPGRAARPAAPFHQDRPSTRSPACLWPLGLLATAALLGVARAADGRGAVLASPARPTRGAANVLLDHMLAMSAGLARHEAPNAGAPRRAPRPLAPGASGLPDHRFPYRSVHADDGSPIERAIYAAYRWVDWRALRAGLRDAADALTVVQALHPDVTLDADALGARCAEAGTSLAHLRAGSTLAQRRLLDEAVWLVAVSDQPMPPPQAARRVPPRPSPDALGQADLALCQALARRHQRERLRAALGAPAIGAALALPRARGLRLGDLVDDVRFHGVPGWRALDAPARRTLLADALSERGEDPHYAVGSLAHSMATLVRKLALLRGEAAPADLDDESNLLRHFVAAIVPARPAPPGIDAAALFAAHLANAAGDTLGHARMSTAERCAALRDYARERWLAHYGLPPRPVPAHLEGDDRERAVARLTEHGWVRARARENLRLRGQAHDAHAERDEVRALVASLTDPRAEAGHHHAVRHAASRIPWLGAVAAALDNLVHHRDVDAVLGVLPVARAWFGPAPVVGTDAPAALSVPFARVFPVLGDASDLVCGLAQGNLTRIAIDGIDLYVDAAFTTPLGAMRDLLRAEHLPEPLQAGMRIARALGHAFGRAVRAFRMCPAASSVVSPATSTAAVPHWRDPRRVGHLRPPLRSWSGAGIAGRRAASAAAAPAGGVAQAARAEPALDVLIPAEILYRADGMLRRVSDTHTVRRLLWLFGYARDTTARTDIGAVMSRFVIVAEHLRDAAGAAFDPLGCIADVYARSPTFRRLCNFAIDHEFAGNVLRGREAEQVASRDIERIARAGSLPWVIRASPNGQPGVSFTRRAIWLADRDANGHTISYLAAGGTERVSSLTDVFLHEFIHALTGLADFDLQDEYEPIGQGLGEAGPVVWLCNRIARESGLASPARIAYRSTMWDGTGSTSIQEEERLFSEALRRHPGAPAFLGARERAERLLALQDAYLDRMFVVARAVEAPLGDGNRAAGLG